MSVSAGCIRRVVQGIMLAALLAFSLVSRAAAAGAQLTLVSDYLHRGLLQTEHGPAYQVSLHHRFETGAFVGIWTSKVDYPFTDSIDYELDYFAGYERRLSRNVAVDVTIIRYTYPGSDLQRDYDWNELQLTAYLGDKWTLSWGLSDNWLGRSAKSRFIETSYRTPLPAGITADVTAGYQMTEKILGNDYGYAEIGISRPLGPFHARLAFSATDDHASDIFGARAANRWLASLTWKI